KVEDMRPTYPLGIMNNNLQPVKEEYLTYLKSSKDTLEKDYITRSFIELKSEVDKDKKEADAIFTNKRINTAAYACAFKTQLNSLTDKQNELTDKVTKLTNLY